MATDERTPSILLEFARKNPALSVMVASFFTVSKLHDSHHKYGHEDFLHQDHIRKIR